MTLIVETVTIDADMEAVFDLISQVEKFPLYADFLTEVRKIDDRTYRWVARGRGITLTWDSIITEYQRPVRLAWRSIRGLRNSGAYTLTRSTRGTTVSILIEYHLPGEFLERLAAPLAAPLARSLAARVLAQSQEGAEVRRFGKQGKDARRKTLARTLTAQPRPRSARGQRQRSPRASAVAPLRVMSGNRDRPQHPLPTHSYPSRVPEHRPLLGTDADRRYDRHGHRADLHAADFCVRFPPLAADHSAVYEYTA